MLVKLSNFGREAERAQRKKAVAARLPEVAFELCSKRSRLRRREGSTAPQWALQPNVAADCAEHASLHSDTILGPIGLIWLKSCNL